MMTQTRQRLLWKEALEVSRYALPSFLLYVAFFWLSVQPEDITHDPNPGRHPQWFGLLSAVVGAVIGFSQMSRESQGDLWSFTMHRRVSARTTMATKVIVGITTLVLIAGVPYLVSLIWLSIPGHRAVPFYWGMGLAGVGDLLSAAMFYGAGLLAGARRSSVLTRSVGFVSAIAIGLVVAGATNFLAAAVVAALMAGVLISAAGATFASGTEFDRQSLWGRVANVLASAPGLIVVQILAMMIVSAFIPRSEAPVERPAERRYGSIAPDGRLVLVTLGPPFTDPRMNELPTFKTVTDLEGNRLPDLEASSQTELFSRRLIVASDELTIDPRYVAMVQPTPGGRATSRYFVRMFSHQGAIWYFEPSIGLISIYDPATRRLSGWLGPKGFSAFPTMPADRFTGKVVGEFRGMVPQLSATLVLTSGVYEINGTSAPRLIFAPPAGEEVLDETQSGGRGGPTPPDTGSTYFRAVSTTRATYVLHNRTGAIELVAPHDTTAHSVYIARAVWAPGQPTWLWYSPGFRTRADTFSHAVRYDRSGSASARVTVPAIRYNEDFFQSRAGSGSIALTSIGPSSATEVAIGPFILLASETGPSRVPTRQILGAFVVNLFFAGAVLVLARRRRMGSLETVAWTGWGLLLGPVALVTMWMLLEWPAREACSACGRARVVTRDQCEHCNADWPRPAYDGTEIFAI